MNETRREFLGGSLLAGAAVGVGLLADKLLQKSAKPETPGPLTPALTPQGKVIQVEMDHAGVAHEHSMPMPPHPNAGGAHLQQMPQHPLTALEREQVRQGVPGRKWVMVIDLAKCSGCGNCTIACSKMHGTPVDRQWMRVFRMQDAQFTASYWFPKPCFHCDNPPCTRVCPVGATFKRQDGVVLIDNERCIGCRFCMAACPYSTRFFNWGVPDNSKVENVAYSPETGVPRRIGTVEKCDFCPDMAAQGILPGCVTGCEMGAIYYGDQNEDTVTNSEHETVRLSELLEQRAGYRYLAELGTEPRVYYLPPKNRDFPKPAISASANHQGHEHPPSHAASGRSI